MILYLDVETTTLNKGHPFNPNNRLISYAYLFNSSIYFRYYTDPDFKHAILECMGVCDEYCGFNVKFDFHWFNRVFNWTPRVDQKVWDCQLAEFVISGQTKAYASLNETLESYGLPTKVDKVKEYWDAGIDTADIPVSILEEYNKYDVECLVPLRAIQQSIMSSEQINLVYLLGEDLKTLQHAEYAGILYDSEKADKKVQELGEKLRLCELQLASFLPVFPDHFVFNWDSGDHLSCFLYGGVIKYNYAIPEEKIYKSGPNKDQAYTRNRWYTNEIYFERIFEPLEGTELKKTREAENPTSRLYQTDAPTLSLLKSKTKAQQDIIKAIKYRSEQIKILEMVQGITKRFNEYQWEDDVIHPQYNQNVVITGRLSSSKPNMQNQPSELDELFISRYAD